MEDNTNKLIVTRQILQCILESEACNLYIPDHRRRELHELFLNANETQFLSKSGNLALSFRRPGANMNDYYGGIIELTISWSPVEKDLQDEDGSLWRAEKLAINCSLSGNYSLSINDMKQRIDIVTSVMRLVDSITSIAPEPIGVRTHSNDERLLKEAKEDMEFGTRTCQDLVFNKKLYSNMRIGAVRRVLRTTYPVLENVKPNTYTVSHNFGSRRRPVIKTFTVKVTGNESNVLTRTA